MRLFEILSCVLVLVSSSLLLMPAALKLSAWRLFCVNALMSMAVVIHLIHEGPHWQMLPLYLACIVLLISGFTWKGHSKQLTTVMVVSTIMLVAGCASFSRLFPMFRLPKPTGPAAVGTRILHIVDQNRVESDGYSPSGKRELIIQVWYPAEPSRADHLAIYQRRKEVTLRASYRSVLRTNSYEDAAILHGGPYPVLLYNPGWMGERTEGTYQMEELASHGFIVVAVDHTFYGGLVEFPDGHIADSHSAPALGNFENSNVQQQWALGDKFVRIEAQDDVTVLDHLEAMNQDPHSPWFQKIDLNHVGAMGFSIGGAVAAQVAFQDHRVRAALNLDGWTFGDVASQGLAKPMMVIYEDKSQTLPTPVQLSSGPLASQYFWETSATDFAHVSQSLQTNGGFLLFIAGTRHVDFTDRALFSPLISITGGGSLAPEQTHAIVNRYTLAFFSQELKGSHEPLLNAVPSPFSEVEFRRFPARNQPGH